MPKPEHLIAGQLTINEGAIAIPRDVLRASNVLGEGDDPGEGAIRLPRRDSNPHSEQAMKLEVSEPVIGDLISHQAGSGRRGRPSLGREGAGAAEPVVESANRSKAQLAPVIGNAKVGHSRLPRLRPLAAAYGRCKVAPVPGVPQLAQIASIPGAGFALEERSDGAGVQNTGGPLGVGVIHADFVSNRQDSKKNGVRFFRPHGRILNFVSDNPRRVSLQVKGASLVGNE